MGENFVGVDCSSSGPAHGLRPWMESYGFPLNNSGSNPVFKVTEFLKSNIYGTLIGNHTQPIE